MVEKKNAGRRKTPRSLMTSTSNCLVKGRATLRCVCLYAPSDSCTVAVYDGVDNSGRKLFTIGITAALSTSFTPPDGERCDDGIAVVVSGTTPEVVIYYEPDDPTSEVQE